MTAIESAATSPPQALGVGVENNQDTALLPHPIALHPGAFLYHPCFGQGGETALGGDLVHPQTVD